MNSNVIPFEPRSPAALPSRRYVLTVVFVIVAVVFAALAILVRHVGQSMIDVTDPAEYRATLARVGYPTPTAMNVPSLAHFPPQLSSRTVNPRFFYRPGWGQGGTLLQLRVTLRPDAIRQLAAQARSVATTTAARAATRPATAGAFAPSPFLLIRNATNTEFEPDGLPADFERFVYDSAAYGGDRGWSYGVAVSEQRGEAIYWAEDHK